MLTNTRSTEPNRLILLVATAAVVVLVLPHCWCPVQAGTCWMQFIDGGSCKTPQKRFVARSECCVSGLNVGFTESDMSDQEWFMVLAIGDGTSCHSCLDSCETAKCGPSKRCVMRNGLPKCICSPICKKSAQKPMLVDAMNHRKRRRTLRESNIDENRIEDDGTDSSPSGRRRRTPFDELNNSTWNPVSVVMNPANFYNPVCGTDGRTYKTECQLKKRACRRDLTTLSVAYRGSCQSTCKHVICPAGMYCLQDQYLNPHCVNCSWKCPSGTSRPPANKQVCGVDGRTYRNLCEIRRAACRLGRAIPVAYRGPCKDPAKSAAAGSCASVRCQNRQVCLEDLTTHRPRCVSCIAKCPRRRHRHSSALLSHSPLLQRQQQHPHTLPQSSSSSRSPRPQQPRPNPNQVSNLPTTPATICGTNDLTYQSWCHMLKDSCSTGLYIDVLHIGACQLTHNSTSNAHY